MTPVEMLIGFLFLFILSIISFRKKLFDLEGVLMANAIGLAALVYGPNPLLCFLAIVIFFLVGEIASNYPKKKHGQRNAWNVVGNSLPAFVVLALITVYPENALLLQAMFFGAIAAAFGDTLSSEIGYYSKKPPILITTFKKVSKGVDGGITLLGEEASFLGGVIIAALYFIAYQNLGVAVIIALAGIVGSTVDSVFGATLQLKGKLTNAQVNIIGSMAGAIFALLTALFL